MRCTKKKKKAHLQLIMMLSGLDEVNIFLHAAMAKLLDNEEVHMQRGLRFFSTL